MPWIAPQNRPVDELAEYLYRKTVESVLGSGGPFRELQDAPKLKYQKLADAILADPPALLARGHLSPPNPEIDQEIPF